MNFDTSIIKIGWKMGKLKLHSLIFWSFHFKNNVFIFQEHSKNTKIQVYILPFS